DVGDGRQQRLHQLRLGAVEADEGNLRGRVDRAGARGGHACISSRSESGSVRPPATTGLRSRKTAPASLREWSPNLVKIDAMWLLIVLSARNSASAISALVRPSQTRVRTW